MAKLDKGPATEDLSIFFPLTTKLRYLHQKTKYTFLAAYISDLYITQLKKNYKNKNCNYKNKNLSLEFSLGPLLQRAAKVFVQLKGDPDGNQRQILDVIRQQMHARVQELVQVGAKGLAVLRQPAGGRREKQEEKWEFRTNFREAQDLTQTWVALYNCSPVEYVEREVLEAVHGRRRRLHIPIAVPVPPPSLISRDLPAFVRPAPQLALLRGFLALHLDPHALLVRGQRVGGF